MMKRLFFGTWYVVKSSLYLQFAVTGIPLTDLWNETYNFSILKNKSVGREIRKRGIKEGI